MEIYFFFYRYSDPSVFGIFIGEGNEYDFILRRSIKHHRNNFLTILDKQRPTKFRIELAQQMGKIGGDQRSIRSRHKQDRPRSSPKLCINCRLLEADKGLPRSSFGSELSFCFTDQTDAGTTAGETFGCRL